MASISTDKNGNRTIQFVGVDKKRRSIRLRKLPADKVQQIKEKIELLAIYHGGAPDKDTAAWLSRQPANIYDKLAKGGFAEPRTPAKESVKTKRITVAEFVDGYIERVTPDSAASTIRNFKQTRRCLVEFFRDKPLSEVSIGDAKDFRRWLTRPKEKKGRGLGENTARKRCSQAKQFFADAAARNGTSGHRLIQENPFSEMKGLGIGANDRKVIVSKELADKVLAALPDQQWKLLFALSRYGGLRCPSEHLGLHWGDVNWTANGGVGEITIHSPKTVRHGKTTRVIPIFAELRPYLQAALDELLIDFDPKAKKLSEQSIITRCRDTNANLATQLKRYMRRTGIEPWPALFNSLRSTRETELANDFPIHVVCEWIGNSEAVARKNYLQVLPEHFAKAGRLQAVQNPVQQRTESDDLDGIGPKEKSLSLGIRSDSENLLLPVGLEPTTY